MSYAQGIRPPDEKWRQMKSVHDACKVAGVAIPDEIDRFFDGMEPDPNGVIVDLDESGAVEKWTGDGEEGLIVDLGKLPPDLRFLRFVNSY